MFAHHDTEEAVHATRVLLLADGRAEAFGPPSQILSRPELLSAHGLTPLATAAVFRELGLEERPLEEAEAAELLHRRGLRITEEAAARWAARDEERTRRYGEPVIEARRLSHCYERAEPAVRQVDLTLRRGECVAIIGQNGSGKTTLVKHFNGLLRPTEGEVLVCGQATREVGLRSLAQQVGYVFQNPDHQIFSPTVFDEVAFAPRNFRLSQEEVKARVAESLAAVGLSGREQEDPFSLTKGERQRVAVASVLAGRRC